MSGERNKEVQPGKNYLHVFRRTNGGGRQQPRRDPRARAPDPGPGRDPGHAQSPAQVEGMNGKRKGWSIRIGTGNYILKSCLSGSNPLELYCRMSLCSHLRSAEKKRRKKKKRRRGRRQRRHSSDCSGTDSEGEEEEKESKEGKGEVEEEGHNWSQLATSGHNDGEKDDGGKKQLVISSIDDIPTQQEQREHEEREERKKQEMLERERQLEREKQGRRRFGVDFGFNISFVSSFIK